MTISKEAYLKDAIISTCIPTSPPIFIAIGPFHLETYEIFIAQENDKYRVHHRASFTVKNKIRAYALYLLVIKTLKRLKQKNNVLSNPKLEIPKYLREKLPKEALKYRMFP